jgi:5'(3')-deoxyribonucleotidase
MKEEGLRFNEGKTRHDLVPVFAQEQYAKYADRNWEKGMSWSKVLASLKRHIIAFENGEDHDKETGVLHSAHIMCNAAFLTEYYKIFPQGDDRPHKYLSVPKIGLDIDCVLADWVGAWMKYWDIKDTPDSWFFDRDISSKFSAMKEARALRSFYLSLPRMVDPKDIPFEPHCYVTSRPVSTGVSEEWLDKNGFPTKPVHTVGLDESKVDVIKNAGVEIFVDDRFENFVELNNAGVCCYLFDAPHNQRYDVGYKRIKSLKELL